MTEEDDAKRKRAAERGGNSVASSVTKQMKGVPVVVTPGAAAQQTKRLVVEGKNEGPPSKKGKGVERACARCLRSKRPDEFSKNQRKKKDRAQWQCRECMMAVKEEDTREIHCCLCKAKKQAKFFSHRQRNSDEGAAKCSKCENRELAAQHAKKEIEDRKSLAAEFEKAEASLFDAFKREHDCFLEQLGKEGKEMMSTYSGVVYVITSIQRIEDPFSPRLVGVYTTCEKAIAAARTAFEVISTTYRDGTFGPNDTRLGKFDFSEFLRPRVQCSCRIMGEFDGEEGDADFVAIAVNAVQLDKRVDQNVPFLREGMSFGRNQEEGKNDILPDADNTKVYVLFDGSQGDFEEDISLLGVFRSKEQASLVVRDIADNWDDFGNKDEAQEQIQQAFENDRGQLDHEGNSIAMETVHLDKGNNNKNEVFHDGLWMSPEMELLE